MLPILAEPREVSERDRLLDVFGDKAFCPAILIDFVLLNVETIDVIVCEWLDDVRKVTKPWLDFKTFHSGASGIQ
jgi:hypothetical protein